MKEKLITAALLGAADSRRIAQNKPNVVIVLMDNFGRGELGV